MKPFCISEKHLQEHFSRFILLFFFFLFYGLAFAQITIGFQGGEAGDPWGYTSTGASALAISEATQTPNKVTGTTSLVVGGNTGGGNCFAGGSGNGPNTPRTFTFNALDISTSNDYTRTLTFNWGNRFPSCSGTGWDSGENLTFTAYHNGVAQTTMTLANGNNNAQFSIQTNSYTWTIPPCVSQFSFVVSVTTNRADELLFIDDVKLTTPQLNNPLTVTPISGNTSVCPGTTETYSVTPQSGISYTWSGLPAGASFTTSNGTTASSSITVNWGTAAPGTYNLTVTPANSCGYIGAPQSVSVTILPPPALVTISGPASLCNGQTITLTSSYASGNSWSPNGETTASISVTSPGTYTVSVAGSCGTVTDSHVVTLNASTPANITPNGPTTFCPGNSVTLTSSSSSGNSWSTGETTNAITVSTSGTYTLTVTDVCGTTTASQQVIVSPLPDPQITGNTSFCAGQQTTLTASGGTTYSWSTGETTTSISVSSPGTYTLTATNSCGQATSSSFTVTQNPLPNPQISGNTSFCAGQQTTLTASGGTTYSWSTGETTASITVSNPGTYTVTATNSCGQATSSPFTLTQNPLPNPQISGNTSFCAGQQTTLTASGGTTYSWSTGETTTSISVSSPGTYTVTATNNCGSMTTDVVVDVFSVSASFTANPVSGPAPLQIDFTNTSDPGALTFLWNFGDGSTETSTAPSHLFTQNGNYEVTLTAINAMGCSDTYSLVIEVVLETPSSLTIPNIFTPNGDHMNDLFLVTAENLENYSLQILNRWGNVILTIENPAQGWDGMINGDLATEGTYFYQVTATGMDKRSYNETGFFELQR